MSALITDAHRELARNIMFYHTPKGSATAQGVRDAAQLIADSEARAVEPWRTQVEELRGALALGQENCDDVFDDLREERDQLRAELAAERARLDWLDENAGDIHRYNSNRYILTKNQDLRAAIDAAMKEDAK